MPNKVRVIEKKWSVLTRPYFMYNGSAVVMNDIQAKHPCQNSNAQCPQYTSLVNGKDAWTVYYTSTSFVEIRNAVRKLLYEVGLKKEDIQVVEFVNHDYIITPLT